MPYRPLPPTGSNPSAQTTGLMPVKGINKKLLPQLLTPESADIVSNYIINDSGNLEKRGGQSKYIDASSSNAISSLVKWTSDLYLYSYANTLAVYRISTDTSTVIKSNFVNTDFSVQRYGDYAFVASSGDKIGRISQTLAYDAQGANFATGLVLTGATSGATAIILEDADAGATGTLTLGNITGTFQTNETITDSATGTATSDGTLSFTFTSITAAPKARVIKAIGNRLHAGDLEEDRNATKYCDVDSGVNPPFTTWTVGTTATASSLVSYRNAGIVKVIENLGDVIIVGCDGGKWAYRIRVFDSAGTISKEDEILMYREDSGMQMATQTDEGLLYGNPEGLWILVSVGQDNIKFSDQEGLASEESLGRTFFDEISFANGAIVKDDKRNIVIMSGANDSSTNNFIVTYNPTKKAFATFSGWNHTRYMSDDGVIFAGDASSAKIYKLFDGNEDDGNDIWTRFKQELSVGQLWTRKEMLGQYVQGKLSASSSIRIDFDIYDRDGRLVEDKLSLQWTPQVGLGTISEYGSASWGSSSWGGDIDPSGAIESFAGYKGRVKNFQRLIIDLTESSKTNHTLNWISVLTREKVDIRNRQLSKN